MTRFIQQGTAFFPVADEDLKVEPRLHAGTYTVGVHPEKGFFLSKIANMTLPSKIYGATPKTVERFWHTFNERNGNTGILLTGEKGGGKTMLARTLAMKFLAADMPVILVGSKFTSDAFNAFIQRIDHPCMVMFDEFEKVYGPAGRYGGDNPSDQDSLLTLLDGVFAGKKLFVFTANKASQVSPYFLNRPGRIFYHMKYKGLEADVIDQFMQDNLKNPKHAQSVHEVASMVENFSFDLLQALVEDMNRYNEDASAVTKYLNIRPEYSEFVTYNVTATLHGKPVEVSHNTRKISLNPFTNVQGTYVHIIDPSGKKDDMDDPEIINLPFERKDVQMIGNGIYMATRNDYVVTFTRAFVDDYAF